MNNSKLNFDFDVNYILENDSVLLRPLNSSDTEYLIPFSINEPDTWQFSMVSAAGEENMKQYIEVALNGRKIHNEYPFIVFDKKQNAYAGSTRFYDIQPDNLVMQLGYTWYGEKFRGTQLNKNCKYLLLQFAFEKCAAERVEFRADNDNKRSIAAMRSIGCTIEGVLRSNTFKHDGRRRDSIVLSILKHEWFDRVKDNLFSRL